jgi:hypothetical protein
MNPRPKREALPERVRLYIEKLERGCEAFAFITKESQTELGALA